MCLLTNYKHTSKTKRDLNAKTKRKPKKKADYLIEDTSIKNEAHSKWEADDIYDEDDFND